MIHYSGNGSFGLPVLMYHDVTSVAKEGQRFGLPNYYCTTPDLFREQMRTLQAHGYRAVLYRDASEVKVDEKAVVITFDDGWKGNIRHAIPVLREFNYSAVFFVSVGSIGSQDYMNWDDLQSLLDSGMSVQSHGMSHQPMEELDSKEILDELYKSKYNLESMLGRNVDAISFPHGSYNREVIRRAIEVGFEFFFTSDISPTYRSTFMKHPRMVARIPMTSKVTPETLIKSCQYQGMKYYKDYVSSRLKMNLRRFVGINNYRKIYRAVYRIQFREEEIEQIK